MPAPDAPRAAEPEAVSRTPLVWTPRPLTPSAPPPVAPAPEPAPPPVLAPDLTPLGRYRAMLEALTPILRATLADNAAFLGYSDGRLSVAVRSVLAQRRVQDVLRDLEIGEFFPGFRAAEVRVDADAGRTGNERRSAAEEARRADARAAADASPLLKRLVAALEATVESVVPVGEAPRDMNLPDVESDDE